MKPKRLLALASCALAAIPDGTKAAAQEYEYPPWVAAAQEAAAPCVEKMLAGEECRSDGWHFSKWDLNIRSVPPADAAITVIQGVSEDRPRRGMTYITERTKRADRPMIHGFPGAPEYLLVADILDRAGGSLLLVTREHRDEQSPDAMRLYRKVQGKAELLASNLESRVQAGDIHLLAESVKGRRSFLALVGDALYLCRGQKTEHSCSRFRDIDADIYRSMRGGG
jgi:hypothetical protein